MSDPVKDNEKESLTLIAQSIIKKREEAGLDQRDLANRVGTTQTSIRRLEEGETNVSAVLLIRTAKVLDLDLVELLSCIKPASHLTKDTVVANMEQIRKSTSAMGLTSADIEDFYTQRDLLRLMKLWPR